MPLCAVTGYLGVTVIMLPEPARGEAPSSPRAKRIGAGRCRPRSASAQNEARPHRCAAHRRCRGPQRAWSTSSRCPGSTSRRRVGPPRTPLQASDKIHEVLTLLQIYLERLERGLHGRGVPAQGQGRAGGGSWHKRRGHHRRAHPGSGGGGQADGLGLRGSRRFRSPGRPGPDGGKVMRRIVTLAALILSLCPGAPAWPLDDPPVRRDGPGAPHRREGRRLLEHRVDGITAERCTDTTMRDLEPRSLSSIPSAAMRTTAQRPALRTGDQVSRRREV